MPGKRINGIEISTHGFKFDSEGANVDLYYEKFNTPIGGEKGYVEIIPRDMSGTFGLSKFIKETSNMNTNFQCSIATVSCFCIPKTNDYNCTIVTENTNMGTIFRVRLS